MTLRIALFIGAAALLPATILACNDSDDEEDADQGGETGTPVAESPGAAVVEVVFDGTACTSDTDEVRAGPVSFVFVNDSSSGPGLLLFIWEIRDGRTYDDFVDFYAAQSDPVDIQKFPEWTRVVAGSGGQDIGRGERLTVEANVSAGTYALDCELGESLLPLTVE